jgi:tetratricopeptide (TPR) repeat protein
MLRPLLAALFLAATVLSAQQPAQQPSSPGAPPPLTAAERMGKRLRAIYEANDFKADPNKSAERAQYYTNLLKQPLNLRDRATVALELANEQLRIGDSRASIDTLLALQHQLTEAKATLPAAANEQLHRELAIAYLRLGEQQNCLGAPAPAAPGTTVTALTMAAGMDHSPLSCLYPLSPAAAHQKKEGAEGAIREYTTLLQLNPSSNLYRWLLNIAYQQLARKSDIPPQYLIPETLAASEYDIGYFPNVAMLAGIDIATRSGGALVEDFDGDGLLDILVSSVGPLDPMHFFHNNGDGTFSDRTRQAGLTGPSGFGETGGLNLVLTDYNNDGRPDVLVLRGAWWEKFGCYPPSLLRNNGDGTFTDVTEEAGLLNDTSHPTQTAAWADYDGDGWLDLFLAHESKPNDPHPSQLFHNNHDGTFTLVNGAVSSGASAVSGVSGARSSPSSASAAVSASTATPANSLTRQSPQGANSLPSTSTALPSSANSADPASSAALGFVKGVTWGDYNRDGRPDLYVAAMSGRSYLFRNDGPLDPIHPDPLHWRFTDVTESAGLGGYRNSFPTWFFDYDNDGWPDLFAGGYSSSSMEDIGDFQAGKPTRGSLPHLFHNNHDGTFTDVSHATHIDRALLAMGASFGDLDNDGYLDIYLGTGEPSYESILPNRMFRNNQGRGFQDVTTSGDFGNLQHGHAVAFADIENNGNEDIFEEMGGAYPGDIYWDSLYKNPGHGNHWITLVLQGVQTNRIAYGATIHLTINENGHRRSIYREVGSVSSFGGNPLRQHIGIGQATTVESIEVHWPVSHKTDTLHNIPSDRNYQLTEGSGHVEELHWKSFEIGKSKPTHP